jgi:hypothetical protein
MFTAFFHVFQTMWLQFLKWIAVVIPWFRFFRLSGESIVTFNEAGYAIDLTFRATNPVQLTNATWDWSSTHVWLDSTKTSMNPPENRGVRWYQFHHNNQPPKNDVDTQIFGFDARGFDSGDYFRFTMILYRLSPDGIHRSIPGPADFTGGKLLLKFSDGTVVQALFATGGNADQSKADFLAS